MGYCGIPWAAPESFPLDGAGGFGGDVVDDAVDAAHLVDDAGGGAAEDVSSSRAPKRQQTCRVVKTTWDLTRRAMMRTTV